MKALRFGLVGTGPWATLAHGPGLQRAEGVELVGLWGRSPERTTALANTLGIRPYADYAALLHDVDAVAFSVPPDVQAALAREAIAAGKHLLLDKPVALEPAVARQLESEAALAGVLSVVFFTDRFAAGPREWLAQVGEHGGWQGAWLRWFSALQEPDNPFGGSPWRQQRGALWDTGPHALSNAITTLGPVEEIWAHAGASDLVHLVTRHTGGATATISLTQFSPPAAAHYTTTLWGDSGQSTMPQRPDGEESAFLAVAAEELVEAVRSGQPHAVDLGYGARITELIAEAAAQLA